MPSLHSTHRRRAAALLAGTVACGALLGAPAAQAIPVYEPTGAECTRSLHPGLEEGLIFQDSLGYGYDTAYDYNYGSLDDGQTDQILTGTDASDAYDGWGQLFIGDDPTTTLTAYSDPDKLGCSTELGGRQLAFKQLTIDGLQVQRKLYVPASGTGARFLDSVANPTDAPITTSVFVGDITSNYAGDFGSDDGTVVRNTSSGDDVIDGADLWAVTTDSGTRSGSDPAVASVWGGAGAALTATTVRFGAEAGTKTVDDPATDLGTDQAGWGWEHVTIPAGATYRFASFSAMRADATNTSGSQAPLAATAASDLESNQRSIVFDGLTQAEVASVRNWATPAVTATIAPLAAATSSADTTLSATDVNFGAGVAQCTDGTLTWDFGDGTTATGATVAHRFAVGTASVTLTAAGACGGVATQQVTFAVGAAPVTAAARQFVPTLNLSAVHKVGATKLAKAGVNATVKANVAGKVRLVMSGKGIKVVKTVTVKANAAQDVRLRLSSADKRRLSHSKSLRIQAKLTAAGNIVLVSQSPVIVGK